MMKELFCQAVYHFIYKMIKYSQSIKITEFPSLIEDSLEQSSPGDGLVTDTTVQRPRPSLVWLCRTLSHSNESVCETQDKSVPQRRGNHNNKCMSRWYHPAARHLGKYHVHSRLEHIYSWNKQKNWELSEWKCSTQRFKKVTAQVTQRLWNHEENQIDREDNAELCRTAITHKYTHTLCWTPAPLFQQRFSPSSDINQQDWFPEIENPLSKGKASNTCESEDWARTRVKNQVIRPRHHPTTCRRWSFSIGVSGIISSAWQTCTLVLHMKLRGALGSGESLYRHKNNVSAAILQFVSSLPPLPSHGLTFCGVAQPTSALVAHKIAAFRQEELIDRPSMETRFLNESKQTWKSRPAESLVSPYPPLGRQSRISCICGQTRPPPLPRIARLLQKPRQR